MEKEEWFVEFGGDQNQSPEAPSRSRKRQVRRKQGRCQERTGAGGMMEKSRGVRITKRKEVGGNDPIEY